MPSTRRGRNVSTSNLRGHKPYDHPDDASLSSTHLSSFHHKVHYRFVNLSPGILNCGIIDSSGKEIYHVKTPHLVTMMTAPAKLGLVRACIDRRRSPTIVIHDEVERQLATSWLVPRRDSSARS